MYVCNPFLFSATIWTSRSFKPVESRDVPTSSQPRFFPGYLSPFTSSVDKASNRVKPASSFVSFCRRHECGPRSHWRFGVPRRFGICQGCWWLVISDIFIPKWCVIRCYPLILNNFPHSRGPIEWTDPPQKSTPKPRYFGQAVSNFPGRLMSKHAFWGLVSIFHVHKDCLSSRLWIP